MFQRQLPDPEGEVGQSCETRTLGFPICHDFCTFQPVPQSYAAAGGGAVFFLFVCFAFRFHAILVVFCNILSFQDLFEIMLDIQRMEKLEFGGPKGKLYSEHAAQMYSEFINHCQALQHSENNPLDIDTQVKFIFSPFVLVKNYGSKTLQ